jgi:hypothetical protein
MKHLKNFLPGLLLAGFVVTSCQNDSTSEQDEILVDGLNQEKV